MNGKRIFGWLLGMIICLPLSWCFSADSITLFIEANRILKEGRLDEAIPAFSRVIEERPYFADAYVNRGLAYYEKGNLDRAEQDFMKAIQLNTHHQSAHNNLGLIYLQKGRYRLAISHLEKALEAPAENLINRVTVLENLAFIYEQQGMADRAAQARQKAQELRKMANGCLKKAERPFARSGQGYSLALILGSEAKH